MCSSPFPLVVVAFFLKKGVTIATGLYRGERDWRASGTAHPFFSSLSVTLKQTIKIQTTASRYLDMPLKPADLAILHYAAFC